MMKRGHHQWVVPGGFIALVALSLAWPALAVGHDAVARTELGNPDLTHRMMALMLQLGVILFAARLGNLAFARLRMPPVLGELCAGMLIGPYVLGGVPLPGFAGGLFGSLPHGDFSTIPVSPELYGISTLAAVTLLFMVGLETDLRLFLRYSLAGGLTGIGGVIASFGAGAVLTAALAPILLGQTLTPWSLPCLMIGVIFTATSVGIPSRILAEKRKLDSPEGVTILAGAVIDDVLGVVLLAVVMGMATFIPEGAATAFPWRRILGIVAKTLLFWMAAMTFGLLAARRIGAGLKQFRHRTVIAVMALGLALIVAGLFEAVGLAMIVGAYVTGLSLSRTDLRHVVLERLHGLDTFLVPVFFAVMGMMVDMRQLVHPGMLAYGFLFFVVALFAKLLGAGLPPLLAGFNWRGGLRIGSGMVPRGEVTLLMAGAGLASGVLAPDMLGIVIVMTLFSSLAAPPLMHLTFRGPRPGLRKPPPPGDEREIVFPFPSMAVIQMLSDKLVACFEHEGFYVHLLDRTQGIYQLRKDRVVIGFRRTEQGIVFTCQTRDIPFVRTSMSDVVAELEQTVRELRKPLDTGALQRNFNIVDDMPVSKTPAAGSTLRNVIQPALLCPRLDGETRDAVIAELLDRIAETGALRDRNAVYAAILNREADLSTGLQHGIAVPHARTDAVTRLVCAIGLKPDGVDFASVDGEPARIIVLTLAPAQAVGPYLQFISMISLTLNETGRADLLRCDTAEAMYAVLTGKTDRPKSRFGGLKKRRTRQE